MPRPRHTAGFMEPKTYSKYWIRSLLRDELTRVMLRDARNETPWVKEITCICCEGAAQSRTSDFDSEDDSFDF